MWHAMLRCSSPFTSCQTNLVASTVLISLNQQDIGGLDGSSAVVVNVAIEVGIGDIVKIFINKPSNMVIE